MSVTIVRDPFHGRWSIRGENRRVTVWFTDEEMVDLVHQWSTLTRQEIPRSERKTLLGRLRDRQGPPNVMPRRR